MTQARAIIDYADEDNAKEMRDTLYAEIQNKVMAHIATYKTEVAKNLIKSPEETGLEDAEVENA